MEDARVVHLPTEVLYPTVMWKQGSLIHEIFDVEIPDGVPPGSYAVLVGWYDASNPYASFTDERSRLDQEVVVVSVDLADTAP